MPHTPRPSDDTPTAESPGQRGDVVLVACPQCSGAVRCHQRITVPHLAELDISDRCSFTSHDGIGCSSLGTGPFRCVSCHRLWQWSGEDSSLWKHVFELSDVTNFLVELGQLSQKYGVIIAGCGCCGSPYLEAGDNILDGLEWVPDLAVYKTEET